MSYLRSRNVHKYETQYIWTDGWEFIKNLMCKLIVLQLRRLWRGSHVCHSILFVGWEKCLMQVHQYREPPRRIILSRLLGDIITAI